MWGQPYGSPLEAWLAAPFVAALGPTAEALRLCYFLLGLGAHPRRLRAGARARPRAALPAAVLVACPPPYLLLLSAAAAAAVSRGARCSAAVAAGCSPSASAGVCAAR